ncbi:L,D-transpeptidase [Aridibaculum aurantiacum]|uniref:L,D-transpeptidase n=1 Tax=Aridibaculum aurantiacum TaxID=2810307 RepID=UPI001A95B8A2|nr:L,D-transpeptidase [Aridibaculum aurantiacum]
MKRLITLGALVFAIACQQQTTSETTTAEGAPDTAARKVPDIRLELFISERKVHVLRGSDTLRSYPIAVGKSTHPTPTGEFKIHQIDWNPDWTPPDSDWSKDEDYTPPGHKDNPRDVCASFTSRLIPCMVLKTSIH